MVTCIPTALHTRVRNTALTNKVQSRVRSPAQLVQPIPTAKQKAKKTGAKVRQVTQTYTECKIVFIIRALICLHVQCLTTDYRTVFRLLNRHILFQNVHWYIEQDFKLHKTRNGNKHPLFV